MATVSIQKLAKYYKDIQAIENISLDIQDKEFLTVLGPSGCGKTTLLRLIAGLEVPSNGDISRRSTYPREGHSNGFSAIFIVQPHDGVR